MVELTPEQHVVFQADGVVKIPKAVDTEWVDGILALADRQLAAPEDTPKAFTKSGSGWAEENPGDQRGVALSTRWLGDDAVWSPRPVSDPAVTPEMTMSVPGEYPADDDRFPVGWARS